MSQKPVLGKGLASLLSNAEIPQRPPHLEPGAPAAAPPQMGTGAVSAAPGMLVEPVANRDRHPGISMAMVDEIVTNDYQPRHSFDDQALEELAQSIRVNGIIQPLVVRKTSQGYQLIAGERRLRAAKLAGLKQVPVVIRRATDKEALELALIENIQRQDLNCIDEAMAYQQLLEEFSLTQEEAARRVGKERTTVANFLRLLKLPDAIIDDLRRQILSFGHGKALAGLDDNELRLRARAQVVERKLSVRETEALVDQMKKAQTPGASASDTEKVSTAIQSRLTQISQDLTRYLSAKVEVRGGEKKGKIIIQYSNRLELDRLLATLQNERRS